MIDSLLQGIVMLKHTKVGRGSFCLFCCPDPFIDNYFVTLVNHQLSRNGSFPVTFSLFSSLNNQQ